MPLAYTILKQSMFDYDTVLKTVSRLSHHLQCWHLIETPVQIPDTPLSVQFPANETVTAADNGLSVWVPVTPAGDANEAPGFGLVFLAATAIWKVNQ